MAAMNRAAPPAPAGDVIVIGAGFGGLSAAVLVVAAGLIGVVAYTSREAAVAAPQAA